MTPIVEPVSHIRTIIELFIYHPHYYSSILPLLPAFIPTAATALATPNTPQIYDSRGYVYSPFSGTPSPFFASLVP